MPEYPTSATDPYTDVPRAVVRVRHPVTGTMVPIVPHVAVLFIDYVPGGAPSSELDDTYDAPPPARFALVHQISGEEREDMLNSRQGTEDWIFGGSAYGEWLCDAFEFGLNSPDSEAAYADPAEYRKPNRWNTGSGTGDYFITEDTRWQITEDEVIARKREPSGHYNGMPAKDTRTDAEFWGYDPDLFSGAQTLYVEHPVTGQLFPMSPNNIICFLDYTGYGYDWLADLPRWHGEGLALIYSLTRKDMKRFKGTGEQMVDFVYDEQFGVLISQAYCYGESEKNMGNEWPNRWNTGPGYEYLSTYEHFMLISLA